MKELVTVTVVIVLLGTLLWLRAPVSPAHPPGPQIAVSDQLKQSFGLAPDTQPSRDRVELTAPPSTGSDEHRDGAEPVSDDRARQDSGETDPRFLAAREAQQYIRAVFDEGSFVASLLEIAATAEAPAEVTLNDHALRELYQLSTESLARFYSHEYQHAERTIAHYVANGETKQAASAASRKAMLDILFWALPDIPRNIRDRTVEVRVRMHAGRHGTSLIYGEKKDSISYAIGRKHWTLRLTLRKENVPPALWEAYEHAKEAHRRLLR